MKIYLNAIKDFLSYYSNHFIEVWKLRKTLDIPVRDETECDFLPAHLELIEKPASPTLYRTAHIMIAFVLIAVCWSVFGEVDIVATAVGKTVYSGHSKIIQPIENSMVRQIYVRDGQTVKKGELLVELTSLGAEEELKKANQALLTAKLAKARAEALFYAISHNEIPHLILDNEISSFDKEQAEQLIIAQFNTFVLQKQKVEAMLEQKNAEYKTIETKKEKLRLILTLEKEKLTDFSTLYKQRSLSKHQYLEQKSKCIDIQNEMWH